MPLIKLLKGLRDSYVIRQVGRIKLPAFSTGEMQRKHYIFSGRVQHIGFRLEVHLIAEKTGLTGWIKNTEDGSVEAEIQGEKSKIDFLMQYMKSLKRIKIKHIYENDLPMINNEERFVIL
jgi:acylphosphatase